MFHFEKFLEFSAYPMFLLVNDYTSWEQDLSVFLGNLLKDKCFVSETSSGKPTKALLPLMVKKKKK